MEKSTKNHPFKPQEFEEKWQTYWREHKIFSPDLNEAKKPYYTLMMFPYPSAEGMHVGNMYAHTGADIHGRFRRMQGFDTFEPIGLDGFGIHSENYAFKVGRHPKEQAEISEKNFYRQMRATGSAFDWERTLETYDPDYYKWTQWLFTQMFKAGLAYRDKAKVNYCPSCMTVLSDEQVIAGECERCGSTVEKRELEQWFFKITHYAGRLLDNIPQLDWSKKVKVAQTNWIGRSKGALIRFPIADFRLPNGEKPNFVLLHGFNGGANRNFMPWMKEKLESYGYSVQVPDLPSSENPSEKEQVSFVLDTVTFDENTIMLGHSLGAVVALKVVEKLSHPIAGLVLAGGFSHTTFKDGKERPYIDDFNWEFDWERIQSQVGTITILHDVSDPVISRAQAEELAKRLGTTVQFGEVREGHFRAEQEPALFEAVIPHIEVFTTRPDTLFGATFLVIAPEHPVVQSLISPEYSGLNEQVETVKEYVEQALQKSEAERLEEGENKTGVFTGIYAFHPLTGKKVPVWVAEYVVGGYGTGAVMGVPGHDVRDNAFAKLHNLPIVSVIKAPEDEEQGDQSAYVGHGLLQNSENWNGYHSLHDIDKIIGFLAQTGVGEAHEQYHLRDWLISRQRYWGPPIPMIYCETCAREGKSWSTTTEEAMEFSNFQLSISNEKGKNGKSNMENPIQMAGWYPVPDSDLPVLLPDIKDVKPTGTEKSPLASHPDFYKTSCPYCGGPAVRETDVSDTFLDSSWYFLRYLATDWNMLPFPSETIAEQSELGSSEVREQAKKREKWLPVNIYIGGAEHSVLHLLYARFVTMVLFDLGYLGFEEPFTKFYAHGLMIKEGAKMSKSKGNVVVPDLYIEKYGADTLRTYLMFLGPFSQGGDFYDSGIEGMFRFLRRVWVLAIERIEFVDREDEAITRMLHRTIKEITKDMEEFGYNTAIAKLMEFYNFLTEGKTEVDKIQVAPETLASYLKMLAPFAPHMTEELWHTVLKNGGSIHQSFWPSYDEALTVGEEVVIVVQVNGKRRGEIALNAEEAQNRVLVEPVARTNAEKYLDGKDVKKVIFVPGKIINFVI